MHEERYNVINGNAGLGVLFAGRERTSPGHRVHTTRDHYLFHYIHAGQGRVSLGRRDWTLGAGGGFLLAPGVPGRYASEARDPWVYSWVGFHGRDAGRLLRQVGLDPDHPVLEAPPDPGLTAHLDGLLGVLAARLPGFSLAAEGQMLLILADLARLLGPRAQVDMAAKALSLSWAQAAAEFIQTNHHRAITVREVAAYVGFHPSHLGRLFRAEYGTSVQDWLARVRIDHSKLLLKAGSRPVAEVARSVGYRHYAPFEKRFKALAGLSPTEFRRQTFFT